MTIGELIRHTRKEKGMTQKQVAELCGMADSAIRKYESDSQTPKLKTIQRIAAALGVEWTELVPEEQQGQTVIDGITEKLKTVGPLKKISVEEAYRLGIFNPPPTPIERTTCDMKQMTEEGQNKVADYAADILPRYRAETTPQSPPAPPEGKDTTPAPDAPETPPEGE